MVEDTRIYFMAGLPRSGSTLLSAILRQNPRIHATPTSPLYHYLVAINECANYNRLQHSYDEDRITRQIYRATVQAFFPHDTMDHDAPKIVFDKNRMWPKNIAGIREFINPTGRIVCPVRPIAEVIASYLRLAQDDPANFIDDHLKHDGRPLNNEARAELLWRVYIKPSHDALRAAMASEPDSVLLVQYADLTSQPAQVMQRIYEFCGIAPFDHSFNDVVTENLETKDDAWRLKNLHVIRSRVGRASVSSYRFLPDEAVEFFGQFDLVGVK